MKTIKEQVYNLTTHICQHEDVETEPRLDIMCDPTNSAEVMIAIKNISKEIPRDAKVMIGGHTQIVSLILQVARIKNWKVLFYSTYTHKLYSATFLSRMDRLEIEREQ